MSNYSGGQLIGLVILPILILVGIIGVIILMSPLHEYKCSSDKACEKGERTLYPYDMGFCPGGGGIWDNESCSKKGPAESSTTNIVLLTFSVLFLIGGTIGVVLIAKHGKKE